VAPAQKPASEGAALFDVDAGPASRAPPVREHLPGSRQPGLDAGELTRVSRRLLLDARAARTQEHQSAPDRNGSLDQPVRGQSVGVELEGISGRIVSARELVVDHRRRIPVDEQRVELAAHDQRRIRRPRVQPQRERKLAVEAGRSARAGHPGGERVIEVRSHGGEDVAMGRIRGIAPLEVEEAQKRGLALLLPGAERSELEQAVREGPELRGAARRFALCRVLVEPELVEELVPARAERSVGELRDRRHHGRTAARGSRIGARNRDARFLHLRRELRIGCGKGYRRRVAQRLQQSGVAIDDRARRG
jgi:hypothetical protein